MNILPKKRWHVRTKDNIARVRRDEAKAAEEEKQKQLRIEIAEREARTEFLRSKARERYRDEYVPEKDTKKIPQGNEHVNLFYEVEHNSFATNKTNAEYEKEKKLEKEKYEKQIGYLTYLGQDTNEITGNVSWYNIDPKERFKVNEEVSKEAKALEDPLREIRKYLGCDGVKKISDIPKNEKKDKCQDERIKKEKHFREHSDGHSRSRERKKKKLKKKNKKKRKYSSESDTSESECIKKEQSKKKIVDLKRLRDERIKRELEERRRAEMVLKKLNGEIKEEKVDPEIEQKYNSQFNPHLAKQNYLRK